MQRKLIIPQDIESAKVLYQEKSLHEQREWFCYDALAAEFLRQRGIYFLDDETLLADRTEDVVTWDNRVQSLSENWYQDAPDGPCLSSGSRVEAMSVRSFNYSFASVYRAVLILHTLHEKFGPCDIVTTRPAQQCIDRSKIRWDFSEGLFAEVLKLSEKSLPFKSQWIEVNYPLSQAKQSGGSGILDSFSGFVRNLIPFLKKNSSDNIIFLGNPSLLEPVVGSLDRDTFRLRHTTHFKDIIISILKSEMPVTLPIAHKNEEGYIQRLKEQYLKQKTFWYQGIDLLEVVWKKIGPFYEDYCPRLQALQTRVLETFHRIKPSVVIVDEDVTEFNRTITHTANSLKIPTLVIMHGLPGTKLGFVPLMAGHIAVWGKSSYDTLRSWGVADDRMVITGCPKYDKLTGVYDHEIKASLCESHGLDPAKPLCLIMMRALRDNALEIQSVTSDQSPHEIFKASRYFAEIARQIPRINFIFKIRISNPRIEPLLRELFNPIEIETRNIRWIFSGQGLSYIKACDYLFNDTSSAGIEAILLKKPVIQLNFSTYEDIFPFVKYGLRHAVRNFNETFEICSQMTASEADQEKAEWIKSQMGLVSDFIYAADGRSNLRVAQFIAGLTPRARTGNPAVRTNSPNILERTKKD